MDDRRRRWLVAAMGVLISSTAVSTQGLHVHHSHGSGTPADEPHRRVAAILLEADDVIASGRGFGMAFAADQNGYPGPMHAVEMRDRLALTSTQVATLEALTESMLAAARSRSREWLDAEDRLRQTFAAGGATEASIDALVREIERARADVRLIHLRAHLQTFDVLTVQQREQYGRIRWGSR